MPGLSQSRRNRRVPGLPYPRTGTGVQPVSGDVPSTTREASSRQEDRVAEELGGYKIANSGATPFSKGDVKTPELLVECKTAMKPRKSLSIKREWLAKLREEAYAMQRPRHALVFDFGDGEDYAIIPIAQLKMYENTVKEGEAK